MYFGASQGRFSSSKAGVRVGKNSSATNSGCSCSTIRLIVISPTLISVAMPLAPCRFCVAANVAACGRKRDSLQRVLSVRGPRFLADGFSRGGLPARRALRVDVQRIERLARRHEQAVALHAPEADVGAALGQRDAAD